MTRRRKWLHKVQFFATEKNLNSQKRRRYIALKGWGRETVVAPNSTFKPY